MITVTRYHDFCAGHRVAGHENKCSQLHGHNYRIYFTCTAESLDGVGRVIDFAAIKEKLCDWLERNWDHKMLLWKDDPWTFDIEGHEDKNNRFYHGNGRKLVDAETGLVFVPFNPTAENMAKHLVEVVGPRQLEGTDVQLIKVVVEETRKCSATYERGA